LHAWPRHVYDAGVGAANTIVLVEDDQGIRETMAALLVDEGFVVAQAANGEEGLTQLRAHPDACLVLLDLWMPVLNGWQMLETAKSDAVLAQVPVVVISAAGDLPPPPGAAAFLRKPIRLETLLSTVDTHRRK
jgi:two-component system, chemotaxis family, chemotaxis protein CheY